MYSMAGKYGDGSHKEASKKPGPSAYDPKFDLVHPKTPGKSFGGKHKRSYADTVPGPGAYSTYKYDNKEKGWTIAHRPSTKQSTDTPGPAAYNVRPKTAGPAYSIQSKPKDSNHKNSLPGPDYDVKFKWDKGIIMGREKRLQTAGAQSLMPGPGAYDFMSKFDSPGKGFHIGERYPEREKENVPGPGAYSYTDKHKGPSYSLSGARSLETKGTDMPGPGAYNVSKSYQTVYNSRPATTISGGRRDPKPIDMPGPGNYYMPRPQTGGITMQGRYKTNEDSRSPGPAAYNQKFGTIQSVVDTNKLSGAGGGSSNSFNISPVKMGGLLKMSGMPGPGYYNLPEDFEKGIKFTKDRKFLILLHFHRSRWNEIA